LLVTVIEQKTAQPVTDLKASDFSVLDGDRPRAVEGAEYASSPIDVMLLVDGSLVGQMVQGAASELIAELGEKEQMALVAYHSSADLVQDFTSSKPTLGKALAALKFGNDPRVLDGIFAAADGGFENAAFRRVILLLTAGYEGGSRTSERSVVSLCRKKGVSIYTLYLGGRERGLFEMLARNTGGAPMSMKELSKLAKAPSRRVFEVMRSHYTLTLAGNLSVTDRLKIEVNRQGKYFVSALPLD
jgi:Mg-chelatase subunit ChlD